MEPQSTSRRPRDPTDVVYATLRTSCLEDYQHYTLLLFFIENLSQHLGQKLFWVIWIHTLAFLVITGATLFRFFMLWFSVMRYFKMCLMWHWADYFWAILYLQRWRQQDSWKTGLTVLGKQDFNLYNLFYKQLAS